jgi:hypothetical protein
MMKELIYYDSHMNVGSLLTIVPLFAATAQHFDRLMH